MNIPRLTPTARTKATRTARCRGLVARIREATVEDLDLLVRHLQRSGGSCTALHQEDAAPSQAFKYDLDL